jgi:ADP-heptose:LPS heptosyltransferase
MNDKLGIATRGGLGDCLMMTPAIKSLKMLNPFKELWVFCIVQEHYDILKGNIYIDNLLSGEKGVEMMKQNFEDNQIKYFNPPDILPSLNRINKKYSQIYCDFFKVPFLGDKLEMYFSEDELLAFSENEHFGSGGIITINPTSKCSKNQEWEIKKWARVISELPEYKFIQIGISDEEYIPGALDLRGKLTLRESCIAIKYSILYAGVDSFFSHVASALDVHSVVLFGDSSPEIYSHENSKVVYKNLECSPCYELLNGRKCPYNKNCMNSIQESEVVNEIKAILKTNGY